MKKESRLILVIGLVIIILILLLSIFANASKESAEEGFLATVLNLFNLKWLEGLANVDGVYGNCDSDDDCSGNQFCNLDLEECEALTTPSDGSRDSGDSGSSSQADTTQKGPVLTKGDSDACSDLNNNNNNNRMLFDSYCDKDEATGKDKAVIIEVIGTFGNIDSEGRAVDDITADCKYEDVCDGKYESCETNPITFTAECVEQCEPCKEKDTLASDLGLAPKKYLQACEDTTAGETVEVSCEPKYNCINNAVVKKYYDEDGNPQEDKTYCGECKYCGADIEAMCGVAAETGEYLEEDDDGWVEDADYYKCQPVEEGTTCKGETGTPTCTGNSCKSGCGLDSASSVYACYSEASLKDEDNNIIYNPKTLKGSERSLLPTVSSDSGAMKFDYDPKYNEDLQCVEVSPQSVRNSQKPEGCEVDPNGYSPCSEFTGDSNDNICYGNNENLKSFDNKVKMMQEKKIREYIRTPLTDLGSEYDKLRTDPDNKELNDQEIKQLMLNEDNIAKLIIIKDLSSALGEDNPYPEPFIEQDIINYILPRPESDLYNDYLKARAMENRFKGDYESAEEDYKKIIERLNSGSVGPEGIIDPFTGENPKAAEIYAFLAELEQQKTRDYLNNPSESKYSIKNAEESLRYIEKARSVASPDKQKFYGDMLTNQKKSYLDAMSGALHTGKEWGEDFMKTNFPQSWEEYCESRGIDPKNAGLVARIHYNSLVEKSRRDFQSEMYGCISEDNARAVINSGLNTMGNYCGGFNNMKSILDKFGYNGDKEYCEANDERKYEMINEAGYSGDVESAKSQLDTVCGFSDIQILANNGDTSGMPKYEDDTSTMGLIRSGLGRSNNPPIQFKFAGAPTIDTMTGPITHQYANFDNYPYSPIPPFEAAVYQDELNNLNSMLVVRAGTITAGNFYVGSAIAGGESMIRLMLVMEAFGLSSEAATTYLENKYPDAPDITSFGTDLFDAGVMFGLAGVGNTKGVKHGSAYDKLSSRYKPRLVFDNPEVESKFYGELMKRADNGELTFKSNPESGNVVINGIEVPTSIGKTPEDFVEFTPEETKALADYNTRCKPSPAPTSKPGCFLADTPILMADRSYKNIQDVLEGDKVVGYDIFNNKPVDVDVTTTFKRPSEGYRIIEYEVVE